MLRKSCFQHETALHQNALAGSARSLGLRIQLAQQLVAQKFRRYELQDAYSWKTERISEALEMSWAKTSEAPQDIVRQCHCPQDVFTAVLWLDRLFT
eukprot:8035911-Karenia_brevis.AAC.1